MKIFFLSQAVSLTLCSIFAITAAHADQRDDETRACRADAFKLCSSEIPNEDKISACMKHHVDELSPQCRAFFVKKKRSNG